MPTEVILPKVDMDMATGKISRWFAKDGDTVRKGEPLFEIETDKAAMEVDAPASGTLRDVTGAEDVDIDVGAAVAWIYAEGEAYDGAKPTADAGRPTETGPDPDVETDSAEPKADQVEPNRVEEAGKARGSDVAGRPQDAASVEAPEQHRDGSKWTTIRATPLARRIAREHGVDLAQLTGSGPSGRIQREDVERAAKDGRAAAQAATKPSAKPAQAMRSEEAHASPTARERKPSAETGRGTLEIVRLRDGDGTPILLLHGFGSESASWRPLLSEIGGSEAVLGIDLPGHGTSVANEVSGFDAIVSLVEETILAENIGACHLVGHSLGGAVATAVAAGTACDVRSLLLLAPAGFGPDIDTGFAEGFARATDEAPVRSWLHHLVADPAAISDGFVRATVRSRADGRQADVQTRLGPSLFSNGTQRFEVRSALGDLAMPVKIVAGEQDRVVPLRHFTRLPGRVALHVFERTGHLPQIEQRTAIARLLRELAR